MRGNRWRIIALRVHLRFRNLNRNIRASTIRSIINNSIHNHGLIQHIAIGIMRLHREVNGNAITINFYILTLITIG